MPKIRTNRTAAKRFRANAAGKLKRAKAYASHLLSDKTRKRKRRLRAGGMVDAADENRVRRLLGRG